MSAPLRCEAISWPQVDRLLIEVVGKIRGDAFRPDAVVAIARGGFVPARLLCDHLGVMELASFRIEHYRGQQMREQARIRHPLSMDVRKKSILIVDDLSDTGETFEVAVRHLRELGAAEVRTMALHYKQQSKFEPDYYSRRIMKWRWLSYPWARMEDVVELTRGLERPWGDAAAIAARLRARHGLRVPARTVEEALACMSEQ